MTDYVETGGCRWGRTFWLAANASWPFAKIQVSPERLRVNVTVWGWNQRFEFERVEVRQIRRKRGLFAVGVVVEHEKPEYPPFILYWTFRYDVLRRELESRGYNVVET